MILRTDVVRILFLILLADFPGLSTAVAQSQTAPTKHPEAHWQEAGLPFIQNFDPKEYGASGQNIGVVRDHRGVMYFANLSGVLEYDGVSWRLMALPNSAAVWSLAVDENGVVYVGGEGEFGYLTPDSLGQMQYNSLLARLPQEKLDSLNFHRILTTSHGIYFSAYEILVRLKNFQAQKDDGRPSHNTSGQFRVWRTKTPFQFAFAVRDTVYVPQVDIGLMKLVGDSLVLAPGGHQLESTEVRCMLPFPDDEGYLSAPQGTRQYKYRKRILIGHNTSNLFLYDGVNFKPFRTEADAFLHENELSRGVVLANGTFALGTRLAGVVIIDKQGRLRQIVNKAVGLRHEDVIELYSDPVDGALWLALNNGLSRVDTPAPLSLYAENLGITSSVQSILRHRGRLYVATNHGVYYLSVPTTRDRYPIFQKVPGLTSYSGGLLAIEEALFVANAATGVFQIEEDRVTKVVDLNSRILYQSPSEPDRIYIGGIGLALLQKIDGQWRFISRISDIDEHVVSIVEDGDGVVWLGTRVQGVLRVQMPVFTSLVTPRNKAISVERYGRAHGLTPGEILVFSNSGRVVCATQGGVRRFNPLSRSFVPDSTFGLTLADTSRSLQMMVGDEQGRVWISSADENRYEVGAAVPRRDGSYVWQRIPALRMADIRETWSVFPDSNGVVWFGNDDGIVRYDPSVAKDYAVDFETLVRRVVVNENSTIYGGGPFLNSLDKPRSRKVSLEYQNNTIRFEFAAASYDDPGRNRYQVFLEGFDKSWSAWTGETRKDYTNLPGGDYRFRVRAKNIYEHLSSEGAYEFIILPPWHRTWWAYGGYAVIFGLLLLAADGVQRRRLLKRERERARRRETELRLKSRLEKKQMEADKLKELDQMKSRFFTNISHEFRTPLTLIMGQVDSELAAPEKQKDRGKLRMVLRNAKQLLQLINQLLDLSKIEAGSMTLNAAPGNILPLLKSLTDSCQSLAEQKQIDLRFECEHSNIIVDFETEKIEKIMYNLLSNAIKFTQAGGKINVQPSLDGESGKASATLPADHCLLITVKDTGIGIPKNRLPKIFDRFYQADASYTREHEGTGIGLALTKELVELHGGSISVESTDGFGTTFTVRLPSVSQARDPGMEAATPEPEVIPVHSESGLEYPEASSEQPEAGGESPATAKEIILIVEDNADVREYVRQNLTDLYRVVEAKDGEDGFTKAQEYIPDLIISDVMMPKIDGYEMARKIRSDELTSHIPIIMLTAKAAEDDKLEGLETGVDAYLIKPFSTRELQVRVRKLIEIRRKLREQRKQPLKITSSEVAVTPVDEQFLERLQQIVEENMADENFQVDELCLKVGIGERQLYRKLHALLDCTPAAYIRLIRLDRAKQLLEKNAGTVSEITFQVGYANTSAFARAFREAFGQSPSEFLPKGY